MLVYLNPLNIEVVIAKICSYSGPKAKTQIGPPNNRSLTSEAYVMTLLKLKPEPFKPLQGDVLGSTKGPNNEKRVEQFRLDLFQRVSEAPVGNLLTLEYFLKNVDQNLQQKIDALNKRFPSWTLEMGEAYKEFFSAVDE